MVRAPRSHKIFLLLLLLLLSKHPLSFRARRRPLPPTPRLEWRFIPFRALFGWRAFDDWRYDAPPRRRGAWLARWYFQRGRDPFVQTLASAAERCACALTGAVPSWERGEREAAAAKAAAKDGDVPPHAHGGGGDATSPREDAPAGDGATVARSPRAAHANAGWSAASVGGGGGGGGAHARVSRAGSFISIGLGTPRGSVAGVPPDGGGGGAGPHSPSGATPRGFGSGGGGGGTPGRLVRALARPSAAASWVSLPSSGAESARASLRERRNATVAGVAAIYLVWFVMVWVIFACVVRGTTHEAFRGFVFDRGASPLPSDTASSCTACSAPKTSPSSRRPSASASGWNRLRRRVAPSPAKYEDYTDTRRLRVSRLQWRAIAKDVAAGVFLALILERFYLTANSQWLEEHSALTTTAVCFASLTLRAVDYLSLAALQARIAHESLLTRAATYYHYRKRVA